MAGTEKGGHKAAQTIRSRYGRNFYVRIGQLGGMRSQQGGFASTKVGSDGLTGAQRAKLAGAKGGRKSRHRKAVVTANPHKQLMVKSHKVVTTKGRQKKVTPVQGR